MDAHKNYEEIQHDRIKETSLNITITLGVFTLTDSEDNDSETLIEVDVRRTCNKDVEDSKIRTDFDEILIDGEISDIDNRTTLDSTEVDREFRQVNDEPDVMFPNQCAWCDFQDHRFKIKPKCTQYPEYNRTQN